MPVPGVRRKKAVSVVLMARWFVIRIYYCKRVSNAPAGRWSDLNRRVSFSLQAILLYRLHESIRLLVCSPTSRYSKHQPHYFDLTPMYFHNVAPKRPSVFIGLGAVFSLIKSSFWLAHHSTQKSRQPRPKGRYQYTKCGLFDGVVASIKKISKILTVLRYSIQPFLKNRW